MAKVVSIPDAEKSMAVDMYRSGKTITEVARFLGVHRMVARRILCEHGSTIRPSTLRRLTLGQQERVLMLRQAGRNFCQIAREVEAPRNIVRYFLVERPKRRGPALIADSLSLDVKSQILVLFDGGASPHKLRLRFGISPPVLEMILISAGRTIIDTRQRRGPSHHNFVGRQIRQDGYVFVWLAPNDPLSSMRNDRGNVLEHRLIMARKLGRPLFRHERVHHLDGNKQGNHPDNLELWEHSHPSGQRNGEAVTAHCPTCTCHHPSTRMHV